MKPPHFSATRASLLYARRSTSTLAVPLRLYAFPRNVYGLSSPSSMESETTFVLLFTEKEKSGRGEMLSLILFSIFSKSLLHKAFENSDGVLFATKVFYSDEAVSKVQTDF